MASYVNGMSIEHSDIIRERYDLDEFIVLVFGGDVKSIDIPRIIKQVEIIDENVLIIPFRFSSEFVKKFVSSPKLKVLEGYIEIPSLIKASSGVIYAAGIGLTIEAGVLGSSIHKNRRISQKTCKCGFGKEIRNSSHRNR